MPKEIAKAASNLLSALVRAIVEQPDKVEIQALMADTSIVISVTVAPEDLAAVTGPQGRTQRSLTVIAAALGKRSGYPISLNVCSEI